MDRLIYPAQSPIKSLQIPIIIEEEYDGQSFFDYPRRRYWSDISSTDLWSSCINDELAKRVEIWLFFGLLSEFCGRPIRRSELCDVDTNGRLSCVNTKKLPQILEAKSLILPIDRRGWGQERLLEYLDRLFVEASRSIGIVDQETSGPPGDLLLINSSVRALLQTLISARGIYNDKVVSLHEAGIMPTNISRYYNMIEPGWAADSFHIRPSVGIKTFMKANGWCPAQISHLSKSLSHAALYYLSGLPRGAWRHMDHSLCDESRYPAMNVKHDDYVQQNSPDCDMSDAYRTSVTHVNDGGVSAGRCTPFVVDPTEVASIIESDNGVPLISCSRTANSLDIKVVRAEMDTIYVANSHVWAGGMGNPVRNALPNCQIKRLASYTHALLEKMMHMSIGFRSSRTRPSHQFLDKYLVYSCTREPSISLRSCHRSAHQNLLAKAVLILDPELQTLCHRTIPIEQALAQIQVCPWMSRCWTLREATLSRLRYVQFEDGTLHMESALRTARSSIKSLANAKPGTTKSERRHLLAEMARSLLELDNVRYQKRGQEARRFDWSFKILEEHQGLAFAQTWNNLLDRATSRMSDAHPILAGMQDISCAAIRPRTTEGDRKKAILKAHATLPVDILFSCCAKIPGVERMNAWAPMYPQGQRLNRALGSMGVYTDCLLLPHFTASRLLICTTGPNVISTPIFKIRLREMRLFGLRDDRQMASPTAYPPSSPLFL